MEKHFNIGDKVQYVDPNSALTFPAVVFSKETSGQYLFELHELGSNYGHYPNNLEIKDFGCSKDQKYMWLSTRNMSIIVCKSDSKKILSCREPACNVTDKYFESNCTDGGFVCFPCRSGNAWKYKDLLV